MKNVVLLLYYDLLAIKSWFKSQTISKLFISLAFIVVFWGFSFVIYLFSRGFFYSLSSYKEYGLLTAKYLVNAAVVITSWFALATATVSVYSFLRKSNKQIEYLLSQPVKPDSITIWIFIKSSIVNALFLVFIFSPIVLAYADVFLAGASFAFIMRFCLIVSFLTILTNALASIGGYIFAYVVRDRIYIASIGGLILFFAIMFSLIYLIFPQELSSLYEAPPEKFLSIYKSLPLLNAWLPSTWISKTLLEGLSVKIFYIVLFTTATTTLALFFQKQKFIPLFHRINSRQQQQIISPKTNVIFHYPLIFKDWLSIVRVPSEIGYALFLFSIIVFFYFFLARILIFKKTENFWPNELVIFSFFWFTFFTTAFLLRLVYPLMAKEGSSAWYIFTLPISKLRILFSKLILGLIINTPLLLFSFILWHVLPIEGINNFFITLVTVVTIVLLTFVNVFLGSILPNFKQTDDPEKVSTSGMGLIAFFSAVFIACLMGWYLYAVLRKAISLKAAFISLFTIGLLIFTAFFFLANYFLSKYEF